MLRCMCFFLYECSLKERRRYLNVVHCLALYCHEFPVTTVTHMGFGNEVYGEKFMTSGFGSGDSRSSINWKVSGQFLGSSGLHFKVSFVEILNPKSIISISGIYLQMCECYLLLKSA